MTDSLMTSNTAQGGLLVAVDGPSGTGKSTTCRALADRFGARYVDTGAMYRLATLAVLREGCDLENESAIVEIVTTLSLTLSNDPRSTVVLLDGEDVSEEIRSDAVTSAVSAVSAFPGVRRTLVKQQRRLAVEAHRAVVEGRDIGTTVLPDAPLKVYLTASPEVRAQRRLAQDKVAGRDLAFEQVLANIQRRDEADSTRKMSPLHPADDAIIVDTSNLAQEQVVDLLADLVAGSSINPAGETVAGDRDNGDGFVEGARTDDDCWMSNPGSGACVENIDISHGGTEISEREWLKIEESFGVTSAAIERENLCTVAVVGRPNVGKSSMVNRMLGRREAVVEDTPGVTRDRVKYIAEWNGQRFWVQDTGGWDPNVKGIYAAIAHQAEEAMAEADVIVFVVDSKVGVTTTDEVMARRLQRSSVPVLLVANKSDSEQNWADLAEFYSLGLGEPWPVSALHGRGNADVLDEVLRLFPEKPRAASIISGPRRVALVGRPNVGKSSLLNMFSGEERSVVDAVAGTTVDPVDSYVQLDQRIWRVVDTAGLRKKVKRARGHEYYASLRTSHAIDAAEICVMLIDASQPVSEQDQRILSMVLDSGKALVLAFNKWDLMDDQRRWELEREIDLQLAHLPWVTRVNISAKTGRALQKLEPAMIKALENWDQRVPTGKLNTWLRDVIAQNPPPMKNNRLPRVLFATQAGTRPPTVVLFTTGFLDAGYRRYLERKFREEFGFHGTPVRIAVRIRERRDRKR